jgi:hypothetical protein
LIRGGALSGEEAACECSSPGGPKTAAWTRRVGQRGAQLRGLLEREPTKDERLKPVWSPRPEEAKRRVWNEAKARSWDLNLLRWICVQGTRSEYKKRACGGRRRRGRNGNRGLLRWFSLPKQDSRAFKAENSTKISIRQLRRTPGLACTVLRSPPSLFERVQVLATVHSLLSRACGGKSVSQATVCSLEQPPLGTVEVRGWLGRMGGYTLACLSLGKRA